MAMAKGTKNGGRRAPQRREFDRQLMIPLMLQGMGPTAIMRSLETQGTRLSIKVVSDEMEAIRKLWRESVLEGMSYYVVRELDRLDVIEMEAWNQWKQSIGVTERETLRQKGIYVGAQRLDGNPLTTEEVDEVMRSNTNITAAPSVVKREANKGDKNDTLLAEFEKTNTSEERLGDPRYLAVVMKCTEMRIKLLGLEQGAKIEAPEDDRTDPKLVLLERLSVMSGRINAAREINRGQDEARPGEGGRAEAAKSGDAADAQ